MNIKDFPPITNLAKLEYLNVSNTKISDIFFLVKNKNIKYLDLSATLITDFSPISNLYKLEKLKVSNTAINDISLLEKNIYLKEITILHCNIKK